MQPLPSLYLNQDSPSIPQSSGPSSRGGPSHLMRHHQHSFAHHPPLRPPGVEDDCSERPTSPPSWVRSPSADRENGDDSSRLWLEKVSESPSTTVVQPATADADSAPGADPPPEPSSPSVQERHPRRFTFPIAPRGQESSSGSLDECGSSSSDGTDSSGFSEEILEAQDSSSPQAVDSDLRQMSPLERLLQLQRTLN